MKKSGDQSSNYPQLIGRRAMLKGAAVASAAAALSLAGTPGAAAASAPRGRRFDNNTDRTAATRGRIKQVLTSWPYMEFGDQWDLDTLCKAARDLGCVGVELLGPEEWPTLKKYGLVCGMSTNGMPGAPFEKGLNNPRYQPEVVEQTKRRIEECADAGVENVIAFTGFQWRNNDDHSAGIIPLDEGADNTVQGLKELALLGEEKGVTICVEHLNTRITGHDFLGHPGYQGDDIDYCADIIRRVGSPRVKLLFDIYHVQIMNGDVIARIREYGTDLIGHIHTAGVPGRGELDSDQELHYPAIMKALLEIGYQGYVGQEFIPTRDPMAGLRQAVTLCDI